MANRLMFEVGVSDSVQNLDKLKKELDQFIQHYSKDTAIKLKVDIENLQAVTSALSKIGDTPQLRNLRQEIESINKEFSKLAVGAGGVGDLGVRKMNQEVEDLKQKWDSAVRLMARYNQELELARRNRDRETNLTDRQTYTDQINKLKENIKTQQEVINSAKNAYDKAVKDASQLVDVNTRAEASFREVKRSIDEMKQSMSSMNVNVNIGQDFAKWTSEVQAVSASVRELVEQLQRMNHLQPALNDNAIKSQASDIQRLTDEWQKAKSANDAYEKAITDRRELASKLADKKILPDLKDVQTVRMAVDDLDKAYKSLSKTQSTMSAHEFYEKLGAKAFKDWNLPSEFKNYEQFIRALGEALLNYGNIVDKVRAKLIFQGAGVDKAFYGVDKPIGFSAFVQQPGALSREADKMERAQERIDLYEKEKSAKRALDEAVMQEVNSNKVLAQTIQQLGQKYQHTYEQALKLAELIHGGNLTVGNVQRGLKVGFDQATDIVKTIEAMQKLKQEETKPAPQGGLFDPQKFTTLQEAIDKIIAEINRLQQAFTHLGQNGSLSNLSTMINGFAVTLSSLSSAINLSPTSEYVKKLQTDFEAAQAKVQELTEKLTALAAVQNQVAETAAKAGKSEQQIGDSQAAMFNRYNKLLADIQNVEREVLNLRSSLGSNNPFADGLRDYIIALGRIRDEAKSIASAKDVPDAIAKGMSSEKLSKLASALANIKTIFKDVVSEAKEFNKATDKGSSQAEARIRKLGMAFNELKNYMKANGGSEEMKRLQAEIQGAIQKMRQLMNAGKFGEAINVYERLSGIIRQAATATKEFERAQQSVTSAVSHTNSQLQSQSQILGDLKMMAYQYLSVWGAQQFIHNIIELGGQLEQQRLSIGAILQNAGQATELFDKIKALAIQSPFGVVELDRMSKQLTAYGFEYKELYDWTKRLGDISAATGTGVDRLALALGHVRSEGALSGYTLRQFAMGNVPVLRMLSENLGISTKQVREKVRKKEISYEDVQNVLKQLTDEGGMFYQAQETMSQALNAKFKNLHDAFDIMYGEIAESGVGDALKRLAEILTAGAKEWGRYAKDIMGVAAAFGIAKVAMLAYNTVHAKGVHTSLTAIAAAAKEERENLRLAASYRKLDTAEKAAIANKSALARGWYSLFAPMKLVTSQQLATALSTKKLTQEELLRAVAMRKLNIEKAKAAILESNLSRATKANMLGALNQVKILSRTRIAWIGLGNALKGVLSIAKSFAPLMVISAVMDMFARVSEMKSQAEEASAALAEKAASDMKVLNETFKELQSSGYIKQFITNTDKFINGKRVVANLIEFDDDLLNKTDLTQEIETLKAKLQDLSPMYEGDLVDIDKMDNQLEQFKLIVRKLESIRHANDVTEAMSDVVTDANVKTAGNDFTKYISDTFTQDVKDYEDRLKNFEKDINAIDEQTIENIDKQLGGQLDKLKKKYSLDSKNNALAYLFKQWAQGGGLPDKFHSSVAPTKIEEFYNSAVKGGFSRSLTEQYDEMVKGAKEMAETLSSIVVNQFASDPEGAMYAISTYINKLMSMAKVTDPRVVQSATQLLLNEMRKNVPSHLQESVIDEMQRKMLMEQFMGFLGNTITDSTTPEEAEKALNRYTEMTIQWGEQMGWDLKKIGMDNAEAYRDGIQAKMNSVKLKVDWQKRAQQYFVVNTVFKTNIDKNLDEFAQAVQKDLKEKQAYLDRNKQHLKMTFNIDTDIIMNADKLKAFMDKLAEQGQKKAMEGDWEGAKAIYSKIDKELKPYYDALMSVQEDKSWLKAEGFPEKDPTKGNKGSQEDKDAKDLRERMRILKEAADAYKYWKDKVGEGSVEAHVNEEFGEVLKKMGYQFKDVQQLRKTIQKEIKRYQDIYDKSGKKRPQLLEAIKEGYKTDAGLNRNEFEQDTERFLSKTQIQLDNLTRRWEMFNSVREATGDVKLAIELSGADYAEGQTRNLADSVKQKIEEEFAAVGAVQIPFDIYLSNEEIEDSIKAAMPQANETQIKAFIEDYKKWRDLQRDVLKTDVNTFTKIIGSSQDYATQLQKITTEYDKQKESLDALLKLFNSGQVDENGNRRGINSDQYLKAMQYLDADKELKVLKLSDQYAMYMAGAFGVMRDNVVDTAQTIERKLNKAMKANVIDAKTYAEEMRKVRDMLDKYREESFFGKESPFIAFMNGGLKGSNDYVKSAIQALESKKEPLTVEEQKQLKTLKDLQNSLSKTIDVLSSFAMVLSIAQGVVDGFASAAQSLSEMFDALGKEGAANFWSDVSDSIKAGSSFLQPVNNILQNAMSGNISGVLSSAISAPVDMIAGPIKGFAQLHDKKRERQLEALRRDVQQIDNTLKLIKSLRERSLGYDNGNLRREMAQLYANNSKTINTIFGKISVNDAASEAMSEYYSRGGIRGNGYTQELEALKKQREDYQKMYDAENDKKKSSAEALEEYKVKMAELDEQIKYYIEDLSKELWGIDFQSWADQISDALWTAFENGESAVEAFHDTAKDIIADVAKKMMNIHLIEPLFNQLEQMLFGTYNSTTGRYSGGAIKYDSNGNIDMQGSEPEVLRILGQFFGEGGSMEKNVEAAEQFYDWVQDITGLDFSSDDSKSTGTSIKSITEETADLLCSYVNSIRADLSVVRSLQGQYYPMYYEAMTRGNGSLANIENHTAAIMRSNDAIQKAVDDLYRDFHGLRTSAWKIPIA